MKSKTYLTLQAVPLYILGKAHILASEVAVVGNAEVSQHDALGDLV